MEQSDKILSIVIPTYNRADMLMYLLSFFEEQITRNAHKVELIVCNNASTDNTESILQEYQFAHPYLKAVNYSEHVEVGYSIVRSIENAAGKFFLVYGDDDIPAPYMVDTILKFLEKYPEIGYLCFNRLRGVTSEYNNGIEKIFLAGQQQIESYETYYNSITDFANNHQGEVGFISVNVVLREAWEARYRDVFPNNHIGYEFIVPYLYSAQHYPVLYIQYPLCIHRDAKHSWNNKAYLYTYLGRPRAIAEQGRLGIVDNWRELYQVYQSRYDDKSLIRAIFAIMEIDHSYSKIADEMISYQSSKSRQQIMRDLMKSKGVKQKFYKLYYKVKLNGAKYLIKKVVRCIVK